MNADDKAPEQTESDLPPSGQDTEPQDSERQVPDFVAEIERQLAEWSGTRKPPHLLDFKDRDGFLALFDAEDPLSDRNIRSCWWNGPPPFYACGVLMMWHPMLAAQTPSSVFSDCIRPLFDGFGVEEAFLWQCADTRWHYLSRQDPNHDEESAYVRTHYVERVTVVDGRPSFEVISAS